MDSTPYTGSVNILKDSDQQGDSVDSYNLSRISISYGEVDSITSLLLSTINFTPFNEAWVMRTCI